MWEVRQPLQGHTERMFDRNAAANKKGRKVAFHSFSSSAFFTLNPDSLVKEHTQQTFFYVLDIPDIDFL